MGKTKILGLKNLKKTLDLKKAVAKELDKDFRKVAIGTTRDAKKGAPVKRGILRAGIKWRKVKKLHYEVHDSVLYGKFQELGTIYMPGKFFMRRAADKNLRNLGQKVAKRYE